MVLILLVDDDLAILEVFKGLLEQEEGVVVATASSAEIAMEMLKKEPYDLIIADYEMPEIDGIALLKKIRARDPDIVFIMLTGKGREDVVIEALNNGANYYLEKGGDPEEIARTIIKRMKRAMQRRLKAKHQAIEEDIIFSAHDTEDSKRAENIDYALLCDSVDDILYILDREGRILYISGQIRRYGYEPRDLENAHFRVLVDERDLQKREDVFSRMYSGGKGFRTIFRIRDKYGNIWWFEDDGNVEKDLFGNIIRINGVMRDISDRKLEEDAASVISENLMDGVMILSFEGIILYVNRALAGIMGISSEKELIGMNVSAFKPIIVPEDWERIQRDLVNVEKGKGGYISRYRLKKTETDIITVEVRGKKIQFQGRDAAFVFLRDISNV